MKIEKVSIDDIKPYEHNAKEHPQHQIDQIKESIIEFGNNDPIAVDENGTIIEGHGRYEALRQLGYNQVEIIRLSHLNEEQKKAYILVHNQLTMNTGFDLEILNDELLKIDDIDMEQFDFEIPKLNFDEQQVIEDEFSDIENITPKSKLGDIYKLRPTLYRCDYSKMGKLNRRKSNKVGGII